MKKIIFILAFMILIACSEDYQNGMSASTSYVEKVDTLYVSNTDTLFVSEYDTILVSNTDTIRVSKLDTILLTKTDTVSVIIREILNNIDTVKMVDTLKVTDTVKVSFTDTLRVTDTVKVTLKDTITVMDTVKISDTVYVSVSSSSSSEKIAVSSSSSIDSSSSIEEVKKSVKDSITTFIVDGAEYTLVSRTPYLEGIDPQVFVHSVYDYSRSCEEFGGTAVTSVSEVRKLSKVVFGMISSEENTFAGVRHDKKDYVLCTADSNLCEFKSGEEYYSSSLNFAVSGAYYVAAHKSGRDAGAIMVACKY